MIDFKCRLIWSSYFSYFPVSENGENGLGDEGAGEGNASPPPEFLG